MTDSPRLQHAKGLYLEGIRDGNPAEALDKHTGARYTQHSTGVGDGKEGFMAFFTPFLERNPVRDIQVIRTVEDGQYVFCHVYQNLNHGGAEWVTADLFDTDDQGRVIEHWDVIAACTPASDGGPSMVDGATEIEDLDQTEANKATIRAFVDQVLIGGETGRIGDYIAADFTDHNPEARAAQGLAGYLAQMAAQGQEIRYKKIHRLIGQGNFTVAYSEVMQGGEGWAVFDIFRLKHGKIVEHWDVREKIAPPEEWNNSGKF